MQENSSIVSSKINTENSALISSRSSSVRLSNFAYFSNDVVEAGSKDGSDEDDWCPDNEKRSREENVVPEKHSGLEGKDVSKEESRDVMEKEGGSVPRSVKEISLENQAKLLSEISHLKDENGN